MSDKRRTTKSCLELQEVDGIANKPVQVHNIDHIINDDVQVRESFVGGRSSPPPPEQSRGEQSSLIRNVAKWTTFTRKVVTGYHHNTTTRLLWPEWWCCFVITRWLSIISSSGLVWLRGAEFLTGTDSALARGVAVVWITFSISWTDKHKVRDIFMSSSCSTMITAVV